jgi:hypothetical protein
MPQRLGRRQFAWCSALLLTEWLNLSISPESGLAYWVALGAYVAYRIRVEGRRWLPGFMVVAVAPLISILLLPGRYLETVTAFLGGGGNFPVIPALHIILYLLCLLYFVPLALWKARLEMNASEALLAASAVLCLAMVPGALGRCDHGHVLFYGIVAFLLAPVSLEKVRKSLFLWSVAVILVLFTVLKANYIVMGHIYIITRLIDTKGMVEDPLRCDLAGLEKYGKVMTPLGSDEETARYLKSTGKYVLDYYMGLDNVYARAQLDRKLSEMRSAKVIMIPNQVKMPPRRELSKRFISRLFLCPYDPVPRNQYLDVYRETWSYMRRDFRLAERLGDYRILVPVAENSPPGR